MPNKMTHFYTIGLGPGMHNEKASLVMANILFHYITKDTRVEYL